MSEWYEIGLPPPAIPRVTVAEDGVAFISIQTIDDLVVPLKARRDFTGEEGLVWMTADGFARVLAMHDGGDHRRAKRHMIGETVFAKALLDGYSWDEAGIFSTWSFEEFKTGQIEADNAVTYDNLKNDALDWCADNNAGQWTTVIGVIASLLPGVGTIIGAGLVIGGQVLSAKEAQIIAKRTADEKKDELLAARLRFIKGEISEAEYLSIQRALIQEVGAVWLALNKGRDIEKIVVDDPVVAEVIVPSDWRSRLRRNAVPAVAGLCVGLAAAGLTYALAR